MIMAGRVGTSYNACMGKNCFIFLVWIVAALGCSEDTSDAPSSQADSAIAGGDINEPQVDAGDIGLADALPADAASPPIDIASRIQAAGNTEDEQERYVLLTALRAVLPEEHPLVLDLDILLPIIDRWANGREKYWTPGDQEMSGEGGYLADYFVLQVWPGSESFPPPVSEGSALRPIWALYRGRMLIWSAIENGLLVDESFEEGRAALQEALVAFPENRVIGMYLDRPIPWEVPFAEDPAAPRWANLQRVVLHKLNEVIQYWISARQAPDGQFGGGWGDDVELWRWWTPVLLGFEDDTTNSAHRLLAENIFALPRMEGGYTSLLTDVEHSAEDSGDTITSMLLLDHEDEVWRARAARIGVLMDTLWLGETERGGRQFRSTYFTSEEVDDSPEHACDTMYHSRAAQPALLLWQLTGDAALATPLTDWLMSWVEAAEREESGKPGGLLPAALSYPSGDVRANGDEWWNPGCHINTATYRWPRAVSLLTRALVLAHIQTGQSEFLAPLRALAGLRDQSDEGAAPGSAEWAAHTIGNKAVDAMAKYRLGTENAQFDNILRNAGSAYVRAQIGNQVRPLEDALGDLANSMLVDREAHTSEVRFTDRVFKFHRKYADLFRPSATGSVNVNVLYEMVTGDYGDPGYLPLPAVRWLTPAGDLAVRVTRNETRRFRAELYGFGMSARRLGARLSRLNDGRYRWIVTGLNGPLEQGTATARGGQLDWSGRLPPRELVTIEFEPAQ